MNKKQRKEFNDKQTFLAITGNLFYKKRDFIFDLCIIISLLLMSILVIKIILM